MSEEKTVDAPPSYKDIKKRKKPAISKVPIALDGEFADKFNAASRRLAEAEAELEAEPRNASLRKVVQEHEATVEELRSECEDQIVEFVFRSIGRRQFEDLVDACPPTKAQKAEARKAGEEDLGWDPDTFPPTLIHAAIISPEMTEEEAFELWDDEDWNQAELMALFLAALSVNQQRKVVELGKESG